MERLARDHRGIREGSLSDRRETAENRIGESDLRSRERSERDGACRGFGGSGLGNTRYTTQHIPSGYRYCRCSVFVELTRGPTQGAWGGLRGVVDIQIHPLYREFEGHVVPVSAGEGSLLPN